MNFLTDFALAMLPAFLLLAALFGVEALALILVGKPKPDEWDRMLGRRK